MKKNVRRAIVVSVATVAGIFGGLKLYANKRRKTLELPESMMEDKLEPAKGSETEE